jgi:RNA polymerase sigma-70 factor (ECF subfamily)
MGRPTESRTGSSLLVLLHDPADPQAWKAFVQRYTPVVAGWCRRRKLQDADVDDVTQEVLLKLARYLGQFPYDPAKGRFRDWLFAVARNAWSDIRENRRRAGWGSGDPDVERLLEEQADRDGLLQTLDEEFLVEVYEEAKARVQLRVSRQTWEAFELLAVDGWSGAEVAAKLQIKVATVYVAKNRVQKMLQEEVAQLEHCP